MPVGSLEFISAALLLLGSDPRAAPLEAPSLQPLQTQRPWVLDYDLAQCVAARDYGTADEPISLIIRPGPDAETYEFLIGRRHPGPKLVQEVKGSVDFGRGAINAWVLVYGQGKGKQNNLTVTQFRISAAEMEQSKSAQSVTFNAKGEPGLRLALAKMPDLIKGLQDCAADLKRYWNEGGERDGRIATGSKGEVRNLFTSNDYPAEALTRFQEGTAQFILLIDEQGKVAGCNVVRVSGIPVLDAMGCAVIRERAKFSPALDAKGQRVRSTYITPPVRWLMR